MRAEDFSPAQCKITACQFRSYLCWWFPCSLSHGLLIYICYCLSCQWIETVLPRRFDFIQPSSLMPFSSSWISTISASVINIAGWTVEFGSVQQTCDLQLPLGVTHPALFQHQGQRRLCKVAAVVLWCAECFFFGIFVNCMIHGGACECHSASVLDFQQLYTVGLWSCVVWIMPKVIVCGRQKAPRNTLMHCRHLQLHRLWKVYSTIFVRVVSQMTQKSRSIHQFTTGVGTSRCWRGIRTVCNLSWQTKQFHAFEFAISQSLCWSASCIQCIAL